jgi:DNA-binding MarR family transcriptional regulator
MTNNDRTGGARASTVPPVAQSASGITDSTAFKLHRATVLLDRIADDYLVANHGIRYAPFLVLLMARVLGPTTQQAIAANLGVSRASVTQRVSALVASGLMSAEKSATDARANTVVLTEEGATLVDAAWTGLEQHQNGIDEGVDEPALAMQLDRLIANALGIMSGSGQAGNVVPTGNVAPTGDDSQTRNVAQIGNDSQARDNWQARDDSQVRDDSRTRDDSQTREDVPSTESRRARSRQ